MKARVAVVGIEREGMTFSWAEGNCRSYHIRQMTLV